MQSFTDIQDTKTLTESRSLLVNNDKSILSCFSGTTFPTTDLLVGMLCLRTDRNKLYQLKDLPADWKEIADLTKDLSILLGLTGVNKGTVPVGGTVTFDYSLGSNQIATFQAGAATVAMSGFVNGVNGLMLLRLNNAGLATITFPAINWVVPNGTYTTNIATYLTAIGRPSLSTTQPTWMLVWSDNGGTTIYGKIL